MVVNGLTFQGEQFLASPVVSEHHSVETGVAGIQLEIFISHASEDKDAASSFISLLRSALQIGPEKIRCTSVEGYRLPAGTNFNDQLRKEVLEAKVLLALLSPESLKSTYMLFELGARWGAEKFLAPVLIKGSTQSLLEQPLSVIHAISSSSESDVSQLVSRVGEILVITLNSHHVYSTELSTFCKNFI
jgi:TIR domain